VLVLSLSLSVSVCLSLLLHCTHIHQNCFSRGASSLIIDVFTRDLNAIDHYKKRKISTSTTPYGSTTTNDSKQSLAVPSSARGQRDNEKEKESKDKEKAESSHQPLWPYLGHFVFPLKGISKRTKLTQLAFVPSSSSTDDNKSAINSNNNNTTMMMRCSTYTNTECLNYYSNLDEKGADKNKDKDKAVMMDDFFPNTNPNNDNDMMNDAAVKIHITTPADNKHVDNQIEIPTKPSDHAHKHTQTHTYTHTCHKEKKWKC